MKLVSVLTAVAALLPIALVGGCGDASDSYTLYRSSMVVENARRHVATFDATDGEKYNSENCQQAQELYQGQPGVKVRFWCEKGRFKK